MGSPRVFFSFKVYLAGLALVGNALCKAILPRWFSVAFPPFLLCDPNGAGAAEPPTTKRKTKDFLVSF